MALRSLLRDRPLLRNRTRLLRGSSLFFAQDWVYVETYRGVDVYRGNPAPGVYEYTHDIAEAGTMLFDTLEECKADIDRILGDQEYVSILTISIVNGSYGTVTLIDAPSAVDLGGGQYGFTSADSNIGVKATAYTEYDYIVEDVYIDGVSEPVPQDATTYTARMNMSESHSVTVQFGTAREDDYIETYRGYLIYQETDGNYRAYESESDYANGNHAFMGSTLSSVRTQIDNTFDEYIETYKGYLIYKMAENNMYRAFASHEDYEVGNYVYEEWTVYQIKKAIDEGENGNGNGGEDYPYSMTIQLAKKNLLTAGSAQTGVSELVKGIHVNIDKLIGAEIVYSVKFVRGSINALWAEFIIDVNGIEVENRQIDKYDTVTWAIDVTEYLEKVNEMKYGHHSGVGRSQELEYTIDLVLGFEEEVWGGGICPFPKIRPALLTNGEAPIACMLWGTAKSSIKFLGDREPGPLMQAWNNIDIGSKLKLTEKAGLE